MLVRLPRSAAVAAVCPQRRRTPRRVARLGVLLAMAVGLALGALACVPPKTPMERLTDAAYELNVATRFGRIDVAIPYVAPDAQPQFARNHVHWARRIRVVDMDLVGITPLTDDSVAVDVVISWHPLDETVIRQSQLTQRWVIEKDDWHLTEERRSGGDPGLFPSDDAKPAGPLAPDKTGAPLASAGGTQGEQIP